ncbi:hypothetical protein Tco_0524600 [Tanacetum coccineum]
MGLIMSNINIVPADPVSDTSRCDYHGNLPPPNHVADFPEDELVHPEPAPIKPEPKPNHMNGFALHPLPQQENNMNGWLIEDDDEEEEVDKMEDDKMDVDNDEDDEDDAEVNDEDNVEVVHPYEEVDPLNRPPPDSNERLVFVWRRSITSSTLQPLHLFIVVNMEVLRSQGEDLE